MKHEAYLSSASSLWKPLTPACMAIRTFMMPMPVTRTTAGTNTSGAMLTQATCIAWNGCCTRSQVSLHHLPQHLLTFLQSMLSVIEQGFSLLQSSRTHCHVLLPRTDLFFESAMPFGKEGLEDTDDVQAVVITGVDGAELSHNGQCDTVPRYVSKTSFETKNDFAHALPTSLLCRHGPQNTRAIGNALKGKASKHGCPGVLFELREQRLHLLIDDVGATILPAQIFFQRMLEISSLRLVKIQRSKETNRNVLMWPLAKLFSRGVMSRKYFALPMLMFDGSFPQTYHVQYGAFWAHMKSTYPKLHMRARL